MPPLPPLPIDGTLEKGGMDGTPVGTKDGDVEFVGDRDGDTDGNRDVDGNIDNDGA